MLGITSRSTWSPQHLILVQRDLRIQIQRPERAPKNAVVIVIRNVSVTGKLDDSWLISLS